VSAGARSQWQAKAARKSERELDIGSRRAEHDGLRPYAVEERVEDLTRDLILGVPRTYK
jgi:hypothetical protein